MSRGKKKDGPLWFFGDGKKTKQVILTELINQASMRSDPIGFLTEIYNDLNDALNTLPAPEEWEEFELGIFRGRE